MIYMYLWSLFFIENKICSGKGDVFSDSAIFIKKSMHLKICYIYIPILLLVNYKIVIRECTQNT